MGGIWEYKSYQNKQTEKLDPFSYTQILHVLVCVRYRTAKANNSYWVLHGKMTMAMAESGSRYIVKYFKISVLYEIVTNVRLRFRAKRRMYLILL